MTDSNLELAQELKNEVSAWVDKTFNFIDLSVLERIARNPEDGEFSSELCEHIRAGSLHDLVFEYHASLDEEEQESIKLEVIETEDIDPKDVTDSITNEYLKENYEDEIRQFAAENSYDDNYPMWNTIFEFKNSSPSDEWLNKAQEVGLGVIEGFDCFNSSLFATSCGHSFYGSYWIPLYLKLFGQWESLEKYKGVDFSMM